MKGLFFQCLRNRSVSVGLKLLHRTSIIQHPVFLTCKSLSFHLNSSKLFISRTIATPTARAQRSTKRSPTPNPLNIIEVDEDEDSEQEKLASQLDSELARSTTSISLPTTRKEVDFLQSHFYTLRYSFS